nr:MAG TPA: hypothetical protein [Caudoviricetes sp.]
MFSRVTPRRGVLLLAWVIFLTSVVGILTTHGSGNGATLGLLVSGTYIAFQLFTRGDRNE